MLSLPGVQLCYWWACCCSLHTIATLQQLQAPAASCTAAQLQLARARPWLVRARRAPASSSNHRISTIPSRWVGKQYILVILCFRPFQFILACFDPFQSSPHYKIAYNYFSHSTANITAEVQILDKNASKSKIFLPAFYVLGEYFEFSDNKSEAVLAAARI